jgi:cytochrome bd-type quinol oxidase subunit 1
VAIAFALVFALFAGITAASAPARTQQMEPAVTVPVSEYNARWPREPASGPLPPVVVPAATPTEPNNHTAVPVVAGLLLLAGITAAATGLHVRPRLRRRVAA